MILNLFDDAEEWKPIKEFPHYLVSNFGRVKLARTGEIKTQKREVMRRANGTVSSYYLVVILSDHKGQQGKNYRRFVHRLFLSRRVFASTISLHSTSTAEPTASKTQPQNPFFHI